MSKRESSEDKQKRLNCYVGNGVDGWDCHSDCAFWDGKRCTDKEQKEIHLLPCPFCGGKAMYSKYQTYAFGHTVVTCEKCGACIDNTELRENAVNAWNRRAQEGAGK
jgi:Lar family restriction alleviation protein